VACKKEVGIKIPTEYQEVSANIQEKVKNFWIPGTDILFIGRATIRRNRGSSIKMRVRQLRAHRIGNKSPHKEGQLIKLIPDWYKLVVYYYPTEDRHFEKKMISAFRSKYHKPPFANVKYWTKSKSAGKWNEYSRF
jgi:hypothetical protein